MPYLLGGQVGMKADRTKVGGKVVIGLLVGLSTERRNTSECFQPQKP